MKTLVLTDDEYTCLLATLVYVKLSSTRMGYETLVGEMWPREGNMYNPEAEKAFRSGRAMLKVVAEAADKPNPEQRARNRERTAAKRLAEKILQL